MSSFHFSDEEKPQPASPPVTPSAATPPAPADAPANEAEDDFSFLSQTPAANSPNPAPAQNSVTPQPKPNAASRPKAGQAQARVPGAGTHSPPNNAAQAKGQAPGTPAPEARPPQSAQSKPLQAGTGARPAPRVPDPLSPSAPQARGNAAVNASSGQTRAGVHPVGVPNPAAAPNPPAAAALTPTLGGETAEDVTGMETGEGIAAGFFGLGTSIRRALDMLEGPATWALRVFGILGLLCLAFLLAALFFGNVGSLTASAPKAAAMVRNLGFAAQGFSLCLLVAAVAALLLSYDDNKLGAGLVVVGALLQFGAALLVKAAAGETAAGALIGPAVIPPLVKVGKALFYIGAVKATIDLFDFLWKLPDRVKSKVANVGQGRPTEAKQRAIASQANMLSPCWKLPFCRESIRVLCPAFIAKTTCWKFGRGCYCDEEMIARIVRGEPMESIKAPTRISQGKAPCGRCYIYLEHQTYKFRMLSPLALPATIAIGFFGYPLYNSLFGIFDKGLQSVWGMFSFKPPVPDAIKTTPDNIAAVINTAVDAAQVSGIAQALLGVLLGFFLLIYISKGIEWAIFKAKL